MGLFDFVGDILGVDQPSPVQYSTPQPSETETEIQQEILEILQEGREPSENELLMQDYTKQLLENQLANMPMEQEYREATIELMNEQLAYTRQQLQNLADAKELGEITGDLTAEERSLFDELEANALATLETSVNKQLEDVMGKEIASLVSRGVLQGGIGAETMSRLGEKATEIIAQGTADIASTKMQGMLGTIEANKQRDLQLKALVQSGQLSREQAAQAMTQSAFGMANVGTQMAQQATQWGAGLNQAWKGQQLSGLQGMYGSLAGQRMGTAQNALQAAIAQSQAQASESASKWGALGNVFGGLFG